MTDTKKKSAASTRKTTLPEKGNKLSNSIPKTAKVTKKEDARFPAFFDIVSEALSDQRLVTLRGDIDSSMLAHCAHSLNYLSGKSKQPIEIELTSLGGSVHDGLGIYDKIRHTRAKGVKVNITVFGYAMSMAVPIIQACDLRRSGQNATFLLHEVSYGMRGSHSSNKDALIAAENLGKRVNVLLAERSKLTVDDIIRLTARQDATITATEALEYGLVDVLI